MKDTKPVVCVSEFVEEAHIESLILQIGWLEFVEADVVDGLESEIDFSFSSFLADIVFQFDVSCMIKQNLRFKYFK